MKLVAGIDVGGTNTVFGIINEQGKILCKQVVATGQFEHFSWLIRYIHTTLQKQLSSLKENTIAAVGIGMPNGNPLTGEVMHAPNLPWRGRIEVAQIVKDIFGCTCLLNNDANLAAIGEKKFGIAKGYTDFLMLTLGTGLGSGIFINNTIVYGSDGNAGELGNMIVDPGGRKHWGLNIRGTFETYVSATGLVYTAKEKLMQYKENPSSLHACSGDLTAKKILEAAARKDRIAISCVNRTIKMLGLGLANYIVINSPQAIVLFGGVAAPLYAYKKNIERAINIHLPEIFRGKTALLCSSLPDADAALLGAASQVLS